MNSNSALLPILFLSIVFFLVPSWGEEVGARWGTESLERSFYKLESLPIPSDLPLEVGAFELLPDGRLAIGTRHGDIYFISGFDEEKPTPTYHLYASGLDEIFGLNWRADSLFVTQSCELTRLRDTDEDGRADRFDTISDSWGYENYHEYAFGSPFDAKGNMYVALGLSASYYSRALFRGWVFKVTPDGHSIPFASGLRSPGGIGFNEHDALFYIESQGPWNSSCSLKHIPEGGFMGHPASFNWYPFAPNLGASPLEPKSGSSILIEKERVKELVPYSVIFPYIRMGRSITGFQVNRTQGKFGPFEDQLFLGDFTQSLIMRATTEKVNGVWQGACYPFREGLSTGILNLQFTEAGHLFSGGTNRGWPVRGLKPFALERLSWSGEMPFEIQRVSIRPDGFQLNFTKSVANDSSRIVKAYNISTFTHRYHAGYGGPEVDQTYPEVKEVQVLNEGQSVRIKLDSVLKGHVYEFDLKAIQSQEGDELVHKVAFYTVNEIPFAEPPENLQFK